MRHFVISFIIFFAILTITVFSHNYTKNIFQSINRKADLLTTAEKVSLEEYNTISDIKETFESKKNMLQLFVNKEHIKEIETNIKLLENAAVNNDIDACRTNSIEIVCMLEHIDDYLKAFD